jgi:SAM-dependent methyltransferase
LLRTETSIDYNELWENNPSHSSHPSVRLRNKFIINTLKNESFETLLDAGCGDGFLLNLIDNKFYGKKLTGIDISGFVIEKNKNSFNNINFEILDISAIGLEFNNVYDVVTCSEVIEHLANWQLALKNIYELLKKEGLLILTTQSGKRYKSDMKLGHLQHYPLSYLTDELIKCGFDIKEAYKKGFPFYNLQKILFEKIESAANDFQHGSTGMSVFGKIIFYITYILFLITPRTKNFGPQIFIKAVKK